MAFDGIRIRGARVHNLKNINLDLPRNKLIVITGLSGSGKSSLAFDTIYAEGQRRYLESLSSYARQFLGQMEKPDVDSIEGLSPAISIDQKSTSHNPRSTVGTVTEIYDYLRLLYAHLGKPHCPQCGRPVERQSPTQIVDRLYQLPSGTALALMAPVARGKKGEFADSLADLKKQGFLRVRIDGQWHELEEAPKLAKTKKHDIDVVVDRLNVAPENSRRLADSIETALRAGRGTLTVAFPKDPKRADLIFSELMSCPHCQVDLVEITPQLFSFNAPYGACSSCNGLGQTLDFDPDLVFPDHEKSVREGCAAVNLNDTYYGQMAEAVAQHFKFSLDVPFHKLNPKHQRVLLYGDADEKISFTWQFGSKNSDANMKGELEFNKHYEGVIGNLKRRYLQTDSDSMRAYFESFMGSNLCAACQGKRLKPQALATTLQGQNIYEVCTLTVERCIEFFNALKLTERQQAIATGLLKEIHARLRFLQNVGLSYLSLSRQAGSLSGGESQRIRLATQIGSGLTGVLYILDEPSIGLHPRDNHRLLSTLRQLKDLGNTLIVVEHDAETMQAAEYVVDIGPEAGLKGGHVIVAGTLEQVKKSTRSLTGGYLSGRLYIETPQRRRPIDPQRVLHVKGAREHNLKDLDVAIPLGTLTCVTGVSGSGKSTLVHDILYRALAQKLYHASAKPGVHRQLLGTEQIDKVIIIDQSPIGRTPRSNPATYTGLFTPIRDVFAAIPEAKLRGYGPGRFSFNVKGGRCEACQGDGVVKIEMHFLADVYVPCDICHAKRYNRETLEITYKNNNIAQVLEMTVAEGAELFRHVPAIYQKLKTLIEVGLGYIHLGQSATTLSGGEAQRVKLATELSRRATGKTMYILDEPTTGLHFHDVRYLLLVLQQLVDGGNSVLVIEHNLDVIKHADHVIDLGPEGGEKGGQLVAQGTPEAVSQMPHSFTGQHLRKVLNRAKHTELAYV